MIDHIQKAVDALQERCSAEASEYKGEVSLMLDSSQIMNACRVLRDEFSFEMLADETAVDYWPQEMPRFHVYQLLSLKHNVRISLRIPLDGNAPVASSIVQLYPNANWHEREIWDLFGIQFDGHPDLRRIVMPHDWEGYPLRKDYPLGYEEVMFSFNFDEIDSRKSYAKR
jgi:NADH-quinone oxidoreductase subunit C